MTKLQASEFLVNGKVKDRIAFSLSFYAEGKRVMGCLEATSPVGSVAVCGCQLPIGRPHTARCRCFSMLVLTVHWRRGADMHYCKENEQPSSGKERIENDRPVLRGLLFGLTFFT